MLIICSKGFSDAPLTLETMREATWLHGWMQGPQVRTGGHDEPPCDTWAFSPFAHLRVCQFKNTLSSFFSTPSCRGAAWCHNKHRVSYDQSPLNTCVIMTMTEQEFKMSLEMIFWYFPTILYIGPFLYIGTFRYFGPYLEVLFQLRIYQAGNKLCLLNSAHPGRSTQPVGSNFKVKYNLYFSW